MLETSDFTANYVGTNVRYKFGRAAQHMTEKCRRGYFLLIIFLLLQTPLLYLTLRGSGGTPPPPVFQNASSPVQRYALEDDIVIGILASGRLLARLDTIENTWKKHWPNSPFIYVSDNFEVFTDAHQRWLKNPNYFIPKDENNVPCANTKHGLNCKLEFMYTTMWKKWPNKKWYIRGVDDTWVHKKIYYSGWICTMPQNPISLVTVAIITMMSFLPNFCMRGFLISQILLTIAMEAQVG